MGGGTGTIPSGKLERKTGYIPRAAFDRKAKIISYDKYKDGIMVDDGVYKLIDRLNKMNINDSDKDIEVFHYISRLRGFFLEIFGGYKKI